MKPKEKTIEEKVQDVLAQAHEALKGFTMTDVLVIIKKDKPLPVRLATLKPVEKQIIQTIVGPQEIPCPPSPQTKNERNAVNPIPFIEQKPKKQLKELE